MASSKKHLSLQATTTRLESPSLNGRLRGDWVAGSLLDPQRYGPIYPAVPQHPHLVARKTTDATLASLTGRRNRDDRQEIVR
jgi:hypothetical protein